MSSSQYILIESPADSRRPPPAEATAGHAPLSLVSDGKGFAGGERKLVRVVGSDTPLREAAVRILAGAGYQLCVHAPCPAATAEIDPRRPCCILLESDARALQTELHRRVAAWPVILFGHSKVDAVVQAFKNGALDFIEPPFDGPELIEAVEAGFARVEQTREQSLQRAHARDLMARLTGREREVVGWMAVGLPNKRIAHRMGVSIRTVEVYRASAMNKLQLKSLGSVVRLALAAGLEPPASSDGA